jgi:hypothetical protein
MRKLKTFAAFFVLALCVAAFSRTTVLAATGYQANEFSNGEVTVGSTVFKAVSQDSKNSAYKITMTKDGETTELLKDVECEFVTNGKILYYVKKSSKSTSYPYKKVIYKYTISSGKSAKITSGTEYTVCGCSGTYLYYGKQTEEGGINLYAINVKTKKKVHMVDNAGGVAVSGKRVVVDTSSGDLGNYPIYSFKVSGKDKKKIVDGRFLKVDGSKIYYAKVSKDYKQKIYTCSLTGKNKKAVTKWLTEIPSKYFN